MWFSGSYFFEQNCRFCSCSELECQNITRESDCILRIAENHEQSIQNIADLEQVNRNDSDGFNFYCALSELQHLRIVQKSTADALHDLNEGSFPIHSKQISEIWFKLYLFPVDDLENLDNYYVYGSLSAADAPPRNVLDKRSLV